MNPWIFFSGISLIGLGLGFSQAPATAAITGSLPPSKQGIASAMNDTTKAVGEVTGTAVAGAVLVAVYTNGVASFASGLQPRVAPQHCLSTRVVLCHEEAEGGELRLYYDLDQRRLKVQRHL